MLSLMSTEQDVLRAIDFDVVLDNFTRMKARKAFGLKLKVLQHSTYGDCECKLYNSSFQSQINVIKL